MRLDGKKKIKRLVIYFFYDADGIVDRYVPYMLEDINRNCSELFVIVNGKLTKEGRETFLKLTPNLMVRENVGFDVWAYKTALEHYGWDKLAEYDEVIMMNHTIMGPIYPFSEMFEEMNKRDLDFWGITEHHKIAFDPFGTVSYGYVPEHIQSHFIAVRKLMLKSLEFKNYWETRPKIESYNDAIGKHEAIFTKFFGDAGFVWECYVDAEELKDYTTYPLTMMPRELLEKYRCPIIKRRSFFHDYNEFLLSSLGNQGKEIIDYLTNNTDYDVGMIWENILRSCHMADIHKCMNLSFVLPKEAVQKKSAVHKVALVIHEYFDDLIDYCFKYALSMPEESDIFITTNSEKERSDRRDL
jgi:rhamnosyltransferase